MNLIDIFNDDAFSMTSMTDALVLAYEPSSEILNSGLFTPRQINTPGFVLDVKEIGFNILPLQNRGERLPQRTFTKGRKVYMETWRIGEAMKLFASELAFLLQFGTTDKMIPAAQRLLAERQKALLKDHDATLEKMYLGALNGYMMDSDGTIIEDFFDVFGIDRAATITLPFGTAADGELRKLIESTVVRPIRRAARGARFSTIEAWMGDEAWDEFVKNPEVRETYKIQQQGAELRGATLGSTVEFAGVKWKNYIGDDEGHLRIASDEVRFIPSGENNEIFQDIQAPGESFDDLGSYGQPVYTRVIPDEKRNEYVENEVMSYRAVLCTRPGTLQSGKL